MSRQERGGEQTGGEYLTVQLLHGDQVQGLQGVPSRGDEVEARVNPGVVVVEERPFDLQFLL